MRFIEITKTKKFLREENVVAHSDMRDFKNLIFKYDRSRRLSIFDGQCLIIETDGARYIDFSSVAQKYRLSESTMSGKSLIFEDEKIEYRWRESDKKYPIISFDTPFIAAQTKNGKFCLTQSDTSKGIINRLESDSDTGFVFALGVLAYFWTADEITDNIFV